MLEIRSPMRSTRRWIGTALAVLTAAVLARAQAQTPTPPAASAPAAKPAIHGSNRTGAARQLDLHTPPLNHIYPSSELRYIMAVEEPNADDSTEVSVKGTKYGVQVPGVPGNQLQAIPWAIMHPTQAWRIFTPLESP